MGSYNVSCGLTGLSISPGDEMVAVELAPSKYQLKINKAQSICANDGMASAFFSPNALPVFGIYDDYGRMQDRTELGNKACFHYKAWSNLINFPEGTISDEYPNSDNLEFFGFKKIGEREGRYKMIYTHELVKDIKVYSDGTRVQVDDKDVGVYKLKNLFSLLKLTPDVDLMKTVYGFPKLKKEITEEINSLKEQSRTDLSELEKAVLRFTSISSFTRFHGIGFVKDLINDVDMETIFVPTDDDITNLCYIRLMSQALFCMHKLWLPYVHGPQCGEQAFEKAVLDISMEIWKDKCYEEEEEDE